MQVRACHLCDPDLRLVWSNTAFTAQQCVPEWHWGIWSSICPRPDNSRPRPPQNKPLPSPLNNPSQWAQHPHPLKDYSTESSVTYLATTDTIIHKILGIYHFDELRHPHLPSPRSRVRPARLQRRVICSCDAEPQSFNRELHHA